jgi:hypothetical protein
MIPSVPPPAGIRATPVTFCLMNRGQGQGLQTREGWT